MSSGVRAEAPAVRFTPFALRKAGFVKSQILLEEHALSCVPLQISERGAVLLAVLNARELHFFRRFQRKFCSVALAFQRGDRKQRLTLVLRGTVARIGPLRDREDVAVVSVELSSEPSGLREILDSYRRTYGGLKSAYEQGARNGPGRGDLLPGGSFGSVSVSAGGATMVGAIISVGVDAITARFGPPASELREGSVHSLRVSFLGRAFTASGRIMAIAPPNGCERQKVVFALAFCPDLIEIVDDYYFRRSLERRASPGERKAG